MSERTWSPACRIALGTGSTTAYALAGRGELPFPAHRVGRQWVVPTAGLLAFRGLHSTLLTAGGSRWPDDAVVAHLDDGLADPQHPPFRIDVTPAQPYDLAPTKARHREDLEEDAEPVARG